MYGCESWSMKRTEHWRIDAFELWCRRRLLRVPWPARRSNQSIFDFFTWIFIGRKGRAPILGPPDLKSWRIGQDPDAGKDWRQEKKGMTVDEMVGWHHWLNGQEFEQALGVGDGQGSLAWCSPWGHKESDMTERLNWTEWSQCRALCMTASMQPWTNAHFKNISLGLGAQKAPQFSLMFRNFCQ